MKLLSGGSVSPSGREPLHYENWKLWSGKTKGHGTALHLSLIHICQYAAEIRDKRRPETYKGKGIKYADETIRLKVGKTGKK